MQNESEVLKNLPPKERKKIEKVTPIFNRAAENIAIANDWRVADVAGLLNL